MAITVKHSKVSAIPDDADTSLVRPSDWNADHTLVGLGTMAEQNANNVAITGGSITGVTGVGSVTSVGGTGTVSGIALSGTVTSSGNLTLGGTLDLSSPPTIGNTAPNTGKFTTLEATGTSSLGTTSAQYIQAVGNALYPQIKAVGSGTDIPLVLQPKGTGALQAQLTDSTATGGNARGANAVDWQTIRVSASAVANGTKSVIAGGENNTASNFWSSVGGGYNNFNSSFGGAISGGYGNSNTNNYSFVGGGFSNTTSGQYSGIVGGQSNTATGYYNFIGGGYSNTGTANAAVTTQSGTMNATTAVTLSASNANIKVGQYITGTSIASDTYVAAISGTALTLSKVASGSSTSTLSFFTPHGVVVGGGNNQATGSYSFIGGGGDAGTAANRNAASADWSAVVGGFGNVASGIGAFIGGGGIQTAFTTGNIASGQSSAIAGGIGNSATNSGCAVVGGYQNTANGFMSSVVGGRRGTTRSIVGNIVLPACNIPIFDSNGISQSAVLVLGRETTDATATILRSDVNAASGTNQVILPNNSAYYFKGSVIAGVTGAGDTKGWSIEGVIKRGAGVGTTAIVGTATVVSTYADAGAATWAVTALADTTNGGLKITVTGAAATTIRWVAQINTTEMTY